MLYVIHLPSGEALQIVRYFFIVIDDYILLKIQRFMDQYLSIVLEIESFNRILCFNMFVLNHTRAIAYRIRYQKYDFVTH